LEKCVLSRIINDIRRDGNITPRILGANMMKKNFQRGEATGGGTHGWTILSHE
jgi:hypothetical protein